MSILSICKASLMRPLLIGLVMFMPTAVNAEIEISESLEGLSPEEKAWLLDDSNLEAFNVASEQLQWTDKASKQNYWLENRLMIDAKSLNEGWIRFAQCHHQLDPVAKIEVAYHPENTRQLRVQSHQGIRKTEIENHHVVLNKVSKGAQVCIEGESRTVKTTPQGFNIQRGPYMRKFLDGYYPMIVEETIEMSGFKAKLIEALPQNPKEQTYWFKNGVHYFAYHFEGQLKPLYRFQLLKR